ncbi:MAG: hypothetical protein L0K01_09885, partial [Brachybacterium sp.]|nr:hypothetical protein [Brachybacterium sp.]
MSSPPLAAQPPALHPPTRAGSHRTRALVLGEIVAALVAGLIGLAIGGLGGTLLGGTLLAGGLGGGSDSRVEQNISEGCAILDRL